MVDRPKTVLDEMAERIVEIAPAMARVESVDDVTAQHIGYLAYALGVEIDFTARPITES